MMRCTRPALLTIQKRSFSSASSKSHGIEGARTCVQAMLMQQQSLLEVVNDEIYTFQSPLLHASIGQHVRHSLDHLRKPLETLTANEKLIRYDIRERNTAIEHDRHAALEQIDAIRVNLGRIGRLSWAHMLMIMYYSIVDDAKAEQSVRAAFMLSADGREFVFASTFSREMAFSVHHCIHHNALIKVLLQHHFPTILSALPSEFGMAPSTSNFNSQQK